MFILWINFGKVIVFVGYHPLEKALSPDRSKIELYEELTIADSVFVAEKARDSYAVSTYKMIEDL